MSRTSPLTCAMATPDMSSRHRLRSLLGDGKARLLGTSCATAPAGGLYNSYCPELDLHLHLVMGPLSGSIAVLTLPRHDVDSADHLATLYAATTLEMGRDRPVQPAQG